MQVLHSAGDHGRVIAGWQPSETWGCAAAAGHRQQGSRGQDPEKLAVDVIGLEPGFGLIMP